MFRNLQKSLIMNRVSPRYDFRNPEQPEHMNKYFKNINVTPDFVIKVKIFLLLS